jgi:multidrug efflux pump subunit AcrB
MNPPRQGVAGWIASRLINSKLTPLIVLTATLLGIFAVIALPREEEPQIKVPMIDVFVAMPGFSAKEVEQRATTPMEKLLWEIPGVEYIYSTSREGESLVIVRYKVGSSPEDSLLRVTEKLRSNFDRIPHGVSFPLIKPRAIDDVPILALTFHSAQYDHFTLRRVVGQIDETVKQVPEVAETIIIGGARRQLRVRLDPARLASRGLSAVGIVPSLQQANRQFHSGGLTRDNQEIAVETGAFLQTAEDVGNVIVGAFQQRPVYLREVAEILDGAEEPSQYVFHGTGSAAKSMETDEPAVTLTIAKRPGANATKVAETVLRKIDAVRREFVPAAIKMTVTRNYGETAAEKSNELLLHMGIAVVGVSALLLMTLGWRESIIVAVAIPATLALTLLVFYLAGFTLNRITLFALIFSIGILVDDAIVVVENIVRHIRLPENKSRSVTEVAVEAVSEVGNPTILATWAVIAAVLPMAFVGGLMGPYMRPIPVGASFAMFFSLLIAFAVTPWTAIRIVRWKRSSAESAHEASEDFVTRLYRRIMGPILAKRSARYLFLGGIVMLLLAACILVPLGLVKVKMLPFDNKSEFQVIINMPEGTALERTAQAAREMATAIRTEPEVMNYQIYTGVAAPFNFSGLVRHYFLRRGSHVADVQVNLVSKRDRESQSHAIVKRIRPRLAEIAARYDARIAVAEVPPGPPVLQTLVAEVYGPDESARARLAENVRDLFQKTKGVVDVDWYVEADQIKRRFVIDKEKAALHGISAETISQTLRIAVAGTSVDLLHSPCELEDVNIVLELPRDHRTTPEELLALRVRSGDANAEPERGSNFTLPPLVPMRELVTVESINVDKSIHHKNLVPVTYVIGDVAGAVESPVYAIGKMNEALRKWQVDIYNIRQPFTEQKPAVKWDGEWHITLEVFRDLGMAFAGALVLIFVLMVGWFRSFVTPLLVMVAIPFSLVGILPAHWGMGAFFTATSMIGFMAGAGIVVRNSIILVDFIELRRAQGMALTESVIDAGAVRFRPMMLTALAVVAGAAVILFDPIFQGLALSLMAGEIASLLVSRMAVPVLYFMANQ